MLKEIFLKKIFKRELGIFISEVVIISVVFGFTAGIVGQLVSDAYLNPWDNYDYFDAVDNNLVPKVPVTAELKKMTKFLGIQQDFEVNNAVNKIAPSLVGFYAKKTAKNDLSSQLLTARELLSNGFVLTSDGWLVTQISLFEEYKKELVTAVIGNKSYDVEQIVIDEQSGAVFVKINAKNLPVVVLGDSRALNPGQLLVMVNSLNEVAVKNVKNNNYFITQAGLLSSEGLARRLELDGSFEKNYQSSPVINLAGEVVGLVVSIKDQTNAFVLPLNYFTGIMTDVLKNKAIQRPVLGVNYVDLAWAIGLNGDLAAGQTRGALLTQAPKANTPAAKAGLKLNDIILALEGEQLDRNSTLADLVQEYAVGDEIELEVLRAGKTEMVKVQL